MKLIPMNNYLVVERLNEDEDKDEAHFQLPPGARFEAELATGTEVVRVVGVQPDTKWFAESDQLLGKLAAVEATMLEEFTFKEETFVVVKESHVKGIIDEE